MLTLLYVCGFMLSTKYAPNVNSDILLRVNVCALYYPNNIPKTYTVTDFLKVCGRGVQVNSEMGNWA